jgi:tripeptidyl-peptidase-1
VDYITPGLKLYAPVKRGFGMTMGGGIPVPPKRRKPGPIKILNELESCDVAITPVCVAALYEVPPALHANPSNSMGIFEVRFSAHLVEINY